MDDTRCRHFFLEPTETYHRQYEALRAFFVEKRRLQEIAQQFGYRESYLRLLVSKFRAQVQANEIHPFLFDRRLGDPLGTCRAPQRRPAQKRQPSPIAAR
ncbi:MAG: hypothetical protein L0Z53_12610 [Acidobacteriales bacterium]|nr:hypothetical protein [Terriglobales bacterium]